MAFKYFAFLCTITIAAAQHYTQYSSGASLDSSNYGKQILIQQEQPIAYKQVASYSDNSGVSYGGNYADDDQKYGPAHYEFNYSVKDEHTGDIKEQQEKREGDKVVGFYSLVEPDGHRRIVHYEADKHSGFNAKVDREEVQGYQAPQQQIKYVQQAPLKIVSSHSGDYNTQSSQGSYNGGLNYHH